MLNRIGLHSTKFLNKSLKVITIISVFSLLNTVVLARDIDAEQTERTAFNDIKWKELPGGRGLAHVKGDFTKGAHIKLIKFGAGNKTAIHTHSHDYTGIVIKGVARHYELNKPETQTVLPAGSFWKIPANVPHISECLTGSDCIFVTQSDGKFDIKKVH